MMSCRPFLQVQSIQLFSADFSVLYRKKGGKGAKSGKKAESIVKIAAANSKVWEARLDIAEQSKQEYR